MTKITRAEFTELFEHQMRGTIATAFVYSGIPPGKYWSFIRGENSP